MKFLASTARSGSLPNLKHALVLTARYLTGWEDVDIDAPNGELWKALMQRGGVRRGDLEELVDQSVEQGLMTIFRWLLDSGCPVNLKSATIGAAHGGQAEHMDELRPESLGDSYMVYQFVSSVAFGCSLAVVQREYKAEFEDGPSFHIRGFQSECMASMLASMLAHAAASPSGDWRSKVVWLEEQGGVPDAGTAVRVAESCLSPEVGVRLTWLRDRGYPVDDGTWVSAARRGNIAALEYLLRDGYRPPADTGTLSLGAARAGQLKTLQLLHSAGLLDFSPAVLKGAVANGHRDVVCWLVGTFEVGDQQLRDLSQEAMQSGSLPLLQWLHDRGCLEGSLSDLPLAAGCSEELVEWLVQHRYYTEPSEKDIKTLFGDQDILLLRCLKRLGCLKAVKIDNNTLLRAAHSQINMVLLRFLRELGCPELQNPTAATFNLFVSGYVELTALRWLVEEAGCQVSWPEALQVVGERNRGFQREETEVTRWIRSQVEQQFG